MTLDLVTIIGLIAAACTTGAFIPQVIKTFKTRDTSSISLFMYIVFVSGVTLWLIYGVLINDVPVIVANAITLLLSTMVLILKIRYK